jgi:hypothetical protein
VSRKRSVFFVSDRTGITVETLGHTLLTQFPDVRFAYHSAPFVDTPAKLEALERRVCEAGESDGAPALVFSSTVDPVMTERLRATGAHVFELFSAFLGPLEEALGTHPQRASGRAHGMGDLESYHRRIAAVNYTLAHDDGVKVSDLEEADVVLLGVSRCGKTPTCLYLAMHFHLKAANYPLTPEDLERPHLPDFLGGRRERLFGLTIEPPQLHLIRQERRPGSTYASLAQCTREVSRAEALFRAAGVDFLHTTTVSVEEIASSIVHRMGLR